MHSWKDLTHLDPPRREMNVRTEDGAEDTFEWRRSALFGALPDTNLLPGVPRVHLACPVGLDRHTHMFISSNPPSVPPEPLPFLVYMNLRRIPPTHQTHSCLQRCLMYIDPNRSPPSSNLSPTQRQPNPNDENDKLGDVPPNCC
jgi:hypothetical protein